MSKFGEILRGFCKNFIRHCEQFLQKTAWQSKFRLYLNLWITTLAFVLLAMTAICHFEPFEKGEKSLNFKEILSIRLERQSEI
ncbi:hypothetical protein [Campylobacter troglodytis]|uniref:hypothetical protein n=1 Tax=Campylobacter troglodytis TaxID=654363 RepID=UPI00115796BC|nr:hypothetical protein [Campylobacter troglodytis]TQR53244.1 hypothetical protein DMC01_11560 [Campylobacter troglodytis]